MALGILDFHIVCVSERERRECMCVIWFCTCAIVFVLSDCTVHPTVR